ncbi:hypothetical protein YTPLAS18_32840 [Nitrospira sp.]|nr:hypothetical protein YTPLAS18_32840 [Nitrospira sp.]
MGPTSQLSQHAPGFVERARLSYDPTIKVYKRVTPNNEGLGMKHRHNTGLPARKFATLIRRTDPASDDLFKYRRDDVEGDSK